MAHIEFDFSEKRKLSKPTNSYAFAVLLLIENYVAGVSPVIYMKNYFHKFAWRIREIKEKHPKLTYMNNTTTVDNRYGSKSTFKTVVPTCHKLYLINLYNKLNKEGLK